MKNKIRQILREETSGFDEKTLKVLYRFMNDLTKDYKWYYDTPENRFRYGIESIWLINPKTKQWVLELGKGGDLLWHWDFHPNFRRYFNMELSDFNKFIKIWVEDVLNRGVSSTRLDARQTRWEVEDILKNEEELK